MVGHCKDCKHFERSTVEGYTDWGVCTLLPENSGDLIELILNRYDCTGVDVNVNENFGCMEFTPAFREGTRDE